LKRQLQNSSTLKCCWSACGYATCGRTISESGSMWRSSGSARPALRDWGNPQGVNHLRFIGDIGRCITIAFGRRGRLQATGRLHKPQRRRGQVQGAVSPHCPSSCRCRSSCNPHCSATGTEPRHRRRPSRGDSICRRSAPRATVEAAKAYLLQAHESSGRR
jgi:hypothetical protein